MQANLVPVFLSVGLVGGAEHPRLFLMDVDALLESVAELINGSETGT